MSLIDVRAINYMLGSKQVLDHVGFYINKGDFLCIVGDSGAGKTSLMQCLLGVEKPASGTIRFSDSIQPSTIGFLSQDNDMNPLFPNSVYNIVKSGIVSKKRMFAFLSRKEKESIEESLRKLHIEQLRDRKFSELSGGQKQRVLLARTLCASGGVLMLDEPTSGLDAIASQELYHNLSEIHNSGTTVVMSSSNVRDAVYYATHILHLQNKVLFFGTTQEYIRSEIGRRYCSK